MCIQPGHRSDSTSTKAKFNFVPSHGSPIFMYADRSNRNGFPRFIVFRFLRTEASGGCDVCRRIFRSTWATDTLLSDRFSILPSLQKSLLLTKLLQQFFFERYFAWSWTVVWTSSRWTINVLRWMINRKLWVILIFLNKEIFF